MTQDFTTQDNAIVLYMSIFKEMTDVWNDKPLLWFHFPSWSWSSIKSFSNLCSFYSQIAVVVKGPFIASVKWKSWILQFGLRMGKRLQFSYGANSKRLFFKMFQDYNPQILPFVSEHLCECRTGCNSCNWLRTFHSSWSVCIKNGV